MQSTALALMSCENVKSPGKYPMVPVYDLVCFCDLGKEPPWVMKQVNFVKQVCENAGIKFVILKSPLYEDYQKNFGRQRVVSVPFWTVNKDGKKGKMLRNCTLEYKIKKTPCLSVPVSPGYSPYGTSVRWKQGQRPSVPCCFRIRTWRTGPLTWQRSRTWGSSPCGWNPAG